MSNLPDSAHDEKILEYLEKIVGELRRREATILKSDIHHDPEITGVGRHRSVVNSVTTITLRILRK